MNKQKAFKTFGIIMSILGIILSIFGGYKLHYSNMMERTVRAGDALFGTTSSSAEIWNNHANNYKIILIIGIIILIIGIILFICGLNNKEQINNINSTSDTLIQFEELNKLKEKGYITEEEYENKKNDILNKM